MNSIGPCENDNSHKPASTGEQAAFWKCMYKTGRLPRFLLYLVSSLLFILLLTYLVQDVVDNALGSNTFPVFIFPLIVLVMFILYAPTMPRLYRVRFKEEFRPDISENELFEQLTELAAKSLELISLIIAVTCVLCIGVFEAAKFLSLPDSATVILLALTVLNTYLISLIFNTLGHANRIFLRKTYSDEEYRRYTSLSNYRLLIIALIIVDVLAVFFLYFAR
jgi:hypothetical protein